VQWPQRFAANGIDMAHCGQSFVVGAAAGRRFRRETIDPLDHEKDTKRDDEEIGRRCSKKLHNSGWPHALLSLLSERVVTLTVQAQVQAREINFAQQLPQRRMSTSSPATTQSFQKPRQ